MWVKKIIKNKSSYFPFRSIIASGIQSKTFDRLQNPRSRFSILVVPTVEQQEKSFRARVEPGIFGFQTGMPRIFSNSL